VDVSVVGRNSAASASVRYEYHFGEGGGTVDSDTLSGVARVSYAVVPHAVTIEAGALASQSRVTSDGGSFGGTFTRDGSASQIYSGYIGPSVETQVGDLQVEGHYRFGYTKVEEPDSLLVGTTGVVPVDLADESTTHNAQARIGVRPLLQPDRLPRPELHGHRPARERASTVQGAQRAAGPGRFLAGVPQHPLSRQLQYGPHQPGQHRLDGQLGSPGRDPRSASPAGASGPQRPVAARNERGILPSADRRQRTDPVLQIGRRFLRRRGGRPVLPVARLDRVVLRAAGNRLGPHLSRRRALHAHSLTRLP
jgi:hypothetical protein